MKKVTLYIMVLFFTFSCMQKGKKQHDELLVFGAASLNNVITELAAKFESEYQMPVQLNFASSGTLARQIEHGASPSLYISANEKWVDYLLQLNLLAAESKCKVAGNSLALIAPENSSITNVLFDKSLVDKFSGRLAMGDPKHVPAGEYARQAIMKVGLDRGLKDRILSTKDVRSALMVVELGETELGIVYKTDALKSEKVRIVADIPYNFHKPIGFFAAIINEKNTKQSQLFYNFLTSNKAKTIWIKHGFTIE